MCRRPIREFIGLRETCYLVLLTDKSEENSANVFPSVSIKRQLRYETLYDSLVEHCLFLITALSNRSEHHMVEYHVVEHHIVYSVRIY